MKNFGKDLFFSIMSFLITLLSTSVLPDLFLSAYFPDVDEARLGFFTGLILLFLFYFFRGVYVCYKFTHAKLSDEEKIRNIKHIHVFRLFSISSAYWADLMSSANDIHIDTCIIMIRDTDKLTSNTYRNEINLAIQKWERMKSEHRITNLTIIKYDHIPDFYYAIFDSAAVVTGLNYFDNGDSTGQRGQRDSQHIFADTKEKSKIVQSYINHFENYRNSERIEKEVLAKP